MIGHDLACGRLAAAIAAMYGARKTPRPLAVLIRDRLGQRLDDEAFAAAFGTRGKPGWSPSRLALVTVLQRAEKLTGRQAADAARVRLDWKYLLGLPAGGPGLTIRCCPSSGARWRGRAGTGSTGRAAAAPDGRRPGQSRRQAAYRRRPCHRGGRGAEPAGTGRGKRAGGAGGAGRRAPGLAGPADLRARFRPPPRHPDDVLAAAGIPGQAR
jgi:hypothetical protein